MLDYEILIQSGVKRMESIIQGDNLFVKSGITVIGALAGVGKTTFMIEMTKRFKLLNYNVAYFNADYSPINDIVTYEPLKHDETSKDMPSMLEWLEDATENDIIIIDSLKAYSSMNGFDVMDGNSMMKLMLDFRAFTTRRKCSIIIIHHSFKEKKLKNGEEHFYGSRAIEEQCDSGFLFAQTKFTIIKNRLGLIRGTVLDI